MRRVKKPPEYTLRVRPVNGKAWVGVTPEYRLRRALKALRRAYGLQVVSMTAETKEIGR